MDRRSFCFTIFALVASQAHSAEVTELSLERQPDAQPSPESYRVWSALIPLLQPDANQYLISSITIPADIPLAIQPAKSLTPIERAMLGNREMIDVPQASRAVFAEAAGHYNQKPAGTLHLNHLLTLPHPYRLMSPTDLVAYGRTKAPECVVDPNKHWHRNRRLEEKYAKLPPPCFLSQVSFDESRKLALVCAQAAGEVRKTYCFQDEGDRWQVANWPTTTVVVNC
jgi:hypothetical protein